MFEDSSRDGFMLFIPVHFGYRTDIYSVLTDDQEINGDASKGLKTWASSALFIYLG